MWGSQGEMSSEGRHPQNIDNEKATFYVEQ